MPIAISPPGTPKSKAPLGSAGDSADKKRQIVCFSDFDGTIFKQDTGHVLFDNYGCGTEQRRTLDEQIKTGARPFRDVSEEMWGSVNVPFEDGFKIMKEKLEMDPDFEAFHQYCVENGIPLNVISAGLKPVLRKVLDTFLGKEKSAYINIVANEADINADGSQWRPVWRHDNELGHDKAISMTEARQSAEAECDDDTVPLIVFIGDGVSDLPAAREADVLFAKRGERLEEYCIENNISYIPFDTFADIQREIQKIREEDDEATGGRGLPVRYNPGANVWRRMSGNASVPRSMPPVDKELKEFFQRDNSTQGKTTRAEEPARSQGISA